MDRYMILGMFGEKAKQGIYDRKTRISYTEDRSDKMVSVKTDDLNNIYVRFEAHYLFPRTEKMQ